MCFIIHKLRKANRAVDVKTCIQQFSDNVAVSVTGCKVQGWLGGQIVTWRCRRWDGREKSDHGLDAAVLNGEVKSSFWLLVSDVNVSVILQTCYNTLSSTTTNYFLYTRYSAHSPLKQLLQLWFDFDWLRLDYDEKWKCSFFSSHREAS